MIKSHSLVVYSRTAVIGTEGERTFTYSLLKTISCDVQPNSFSEVQLKTWGITDNVSDVRIVFFDKDATILRLMRAIVDGETYEIRAINRWPNHDEMVLTPVQGI